MGGSKAPSQTTESSGSVQRQPTAEETRLNQLDVSLREATNPQLIETQKKGLSLASILLGGGDEYGLDGYGNPTGGRSYGAGQSDQLPGWMRNMTQGISPDVTRSIVGQSMNDVNAGMAGRNLLDSGTAAAVGYRASTDIRRAAEEFNIGNKLNMLNLALTGQAQIQQPVLGFSSNVGQRLNNLATTTQTGSVTRYGAVGGGLTW